MHRRAILNVCMPYTSRDEMAASIRTTVTSVRSGDLSMSSVLTPVFFLLFPLSHLNARLTLCMISFDVLKGGHGRENLRKPVYYPRR